MKTAWTDELQRKGAQFEKAINLHVLKTLTNKYGISLQSESFYNPF